MPPPAPIVEFDTPTSIDVSWAGRPDEGIQTYSYDIKAIDWSTEEEFIQNTGTASPYFTFQGLTTGVEYKF